MFLVIIYLWVFVMLIYMVAYIFFYFQNTFSISPKSSISLIKHICKTSTFIIESICIPNQSDSKNASSHIIYVSHVRNTTYSRFLFTYQHAHRNRSHFKPYIYCQPRCECRIYMDSLPFNWHLCIL